MRKILTIQWVVANFIYIEVKHNNVRDEATMCKGQSVFPRVATAAAKKWGLK